MTRHQTAYERGYEKGRGEGRAEAYANGHNDGWFAARRSAQDELPEITDDMVERLAKHIYETTSEIAPSASWDKTITAIPPRGDRYRALARAQLEAAFGPAAEWTELGYITTEETQP